MTLAQALVESAKILVIDQLFPTVVATDNIVAMIQSLVISRQPLGVLKEKRQYLAVVYQFASASLPDAYLT